MHCNYGDVQCNQPPRKGSILLSTCPTKQMHSITQKPYKLRSSSQGTHTHSHMYRLVHTHMYRLVHTYMYRLVHTYMYRLVHTYMYRLVHTYMCRASERRNRRKPCKFSPWKIMPTEAMHAMHGRSTEAIFYRR